jgi:hypothetical protein
MTSSHAAPTPPSRFDPRTTRLGNLVARDVTATVSGSGRLLVDANRTLEASIPGNGVIVYTGRATHVRQDVSGSGAVLQG